VMIPSSDMKGIGNARWEVGVMGLFFRKSIKVGNAGRINLSKSGIGGSVGVPGVRAGVSSRGEKYVRGGKGGVYFYETVGSRGGGGEPDYSSTAVVGGVGA